MCSKSAETKQEHNSNASSFDQIQNMFHSQHENNGFKLNYGFKMQMWNEALGQFLLRDALRILLQNPVEQNIHVSSVRKIDTKAL